MSTIAELTTTFETDRPFDLAATLGGSVRRTSAGTAAGHEAWWSGRTPAGNATTCIRATGRRVVARAWGPGADWALDSLPARLGLDREPPPFVAHHDVVRRLHRDHPGLRIGRTGLVWEALAPTILGQKVTTIEAHRSWRSLVRAYGERAPGPVDRRVAPTPDVIAALPYHAFHDHGIERKRAEILNRCARIAPELEAIVHLDRDNAYARLMAVAGIGIWTASAVMDTACGDPDAVPIGDFHVPNTVSWALAGEPRGSDARMIELLEPYEGHRNRVVRLLSLGRVRAPRRGPRLAPRDIRGW